MIDSLLQQTWGSDDAAVLLSRVLLLAERAELAGQPGQAAGAPFASSQLRDNLDVINTLCSAPTLPEIVDALLNVKTDNVWLRRAVAALAAGAQEIHVAARRLRGWPAFTTAFASALLL